MKVLNSKIILTASLGSLLVACGGGNTKTPTPFFQETAHVIESGDRETAEEQAEAWLEKAEFAKVDFYCGQTNNDSEDCTHSYELINLHKAFGYGLSGEGQTIAVLDTGFNMNEETGGVHKEFEDKNISIYGDLIQAEWYDNSHGNFVAGIAAGNYQGNEDNLEPDMMGVAYNADLHISDFLGYDSFEGDVNSVQHWANAINDAAASNAIAQVNSWGLDTEITINDIQQMIEDGTYDSFAAIGADFFSSAGEVVTDEDINDVITALDNFQNHGVVIFALENNAYATDAGPLAGLGLFYPELGEAFITAGNIDYIGGQSISESTVGTYDEYLEDFGNGEFTKNIYHMSAPCGQTASYCLLADGSWLSGPMDKFGGMDFYFESELGTSFVAPQLGGIAALLAEAFPGITPEQIADRMFASADNSFFTTEDVDGEYGEVVFANGITHKFSEKFGHGVVNAWGALNQIGDTSVHINEQKYDLDKSRLKLNNLFGNAVLNGLEDEHVSYYDSLYGHFKTSIENLIVDKPDSPQHNTIHENIDHTKNYDQSSNRFNLNKQQILQPTYAQASLPLQRLLSGYSAIEMPEISYLNPVDSVAGINGAINLADGHLLYGFSKSLDNNFGNVGSDQSLSLAYSSNQSSDTRGAFMAGLSLEQGSLLDSYGTGAWGLDKKQAKTSYMALTGEHDFNNDMSLKMMAVLGKTHMNQSTETLFSGAKGVVTSHFDLQLDKQQAFNKGDKLTFKLSQPLRAQAGQMNVNIPQTDEEGNLHYKQKTINLEPNGQQLDFGINYNTEINSKLTLGLNGLYTKQANHIKENPDHYSMTMTMAMDRIKFGLSGDQFESGDLKRSAHLSIGNKF
jgi:subtilase-type serine protease